ncbi:MAG: response regulator [Patescibacteria group bacterium]
MSSAKKVLLVEDEIWFVEMYQDFLSEEGVEVHSTACVDQAISMAGERHYDCVLLDGKLKEPLDGLRFLHAVDHRRMKVIGVSGNPLTNALLLRHGATAVFGKTEVARIVSFVLNK